MVHYRIHNSPSPVSILRQINPVHDPQPTTLGSILILSHLVLGLEMVSFLSGLPTKTLYARLLFPVQAICPVQIIILECISRKIYGEEYRSLSSSLRNFSPLLRYIAVPRPKQLPQHPILKHPQPITLIYVP